jgi:preprotein translocase subunit SecG
MGIQNVLLIVTLIVAVLFTTLVILNSKADPMAGGGGIRTSFKGKASFDDFIFRWTLGLACAFMALTLILDTVSHYIKPPTH